MKWLIFGGKGWIGGQVIDILKSMNEEIVIGSSRVDDTTSVEIELKSEAPDRVMCLIGRTHGPGYSTIDYLEQKGKLVENIRDNLFSPISLAMLCSKMNIHLTYLGTGCIFTDKTPEETDGYTENSLPNFTGSGYSTVKGFTDRLMHMFDDTALNVRIRMPIVGYTNPRNFITKITKYSKVVNIQNSMTVLPELIPLMIDLSARKEVGTVNLTNPGTISHNEILDMYIKYVDSDFKYENFSIEEQDSILASERSNNKLDTSKLKEMYPNVMSISESVEHLFKSYSK